MNPADNNEERDAHPTRVVSMPLKKNFKVWLDSHNAASWTGTQFDAKFHVDLNQCIREAWRLNSSYKMTFSFISRASTFAVGTVSTNNSYTIHIDLGQGTPTMYRFSSVRTPAGIVRVSSDGAGVYVNPAAASSFDIPVYFNAKPQDNEPVFINNLKNVNGISINLIQAGSGTFNSANDATINTNTKYICCLDFEEV
jgi:hypothetical protein